MLRSDALANIDKPAVYGMLLVDIDTPEGEVNICSASAPVVVDGTHYWGGGELVSVDSVADAGGVADAHTFRMSLARVTNDLIAAAIGAELQDRGVRVRIAVSEDGVEWGSVGILKIGRVSHISVSPEAITVECVTAGADLGRVSSRATLWTDDHQKRFVDADDTAFQRIPVAAEITIPWP